MNPTQNISNKTILLSPLDWGFGHTTRCVSIIRDLLANGNTVIFAGNSAQVVFINTEFPALKCELIEGYNINLSSEQSTYKQIAKQSLKISKAISLEEKWVAQYISKHKIDLILSDNRYGFRHPEIESIFISHQLNIELPTFKVLVNKTLIKYVNKFNRCWIPDDTKLMLSGTLSNPKHLNIPHDFIGVLSRFGFKKRTLKYDYLFIVSGPNPENSIFLKEIEKTAKKTNQRVAIVSTIKSLNPNPNHHYFLLPSSSELNDLINESACIISKGGYTTIMEMISLKKRAILIPTKGQFEQEYLAKHIKQGGITFVKTTSDLTL